MNSSSMRYLSAQGLHNLARNRLMTLAGIGVLTACLVITGVATLFAANVNSLVAYLGSQNETVVYLDPAADDTTTQNAYTAIMAVPGVKSATYVSKQDVLDEYKSYMEEYADLWDEFQNGSAQSLARIMVAVVTIGIIGFMLDRGMLQLQKWFSWDKRSELRSLMGILK